MAKQTKNPVSVPPVEESTRAAQTNEAPEIQASELSSSSLADDSMPSLTPPSESSSSEEGFGAGVWNNSKKVNALYTTDGSKNSWMSIVGTGWVRLNTLTDSGHIALTILAAAAKEKNSNVNYLLDSNQAKEMYVW
ncbi:hypothetical protein GCM10009119_10490 [Algoriphagus jejuensis]|uniref:Uncharacterized protein n=1 Tax=Algoriphagus jejuensis TaxID=419934 RepID=A0ABN1MX97_9BACT